MVGCTELCVPLEHRIMVLHVFPKGRLHLTAAEGGRWLRADKDEQTDRCCYCCCRRRADGDGWMQPDADAGVIADRWHADEQRCCCRRDRVLMGS
ncbi:hypothetical protein ACLOJK_008381 [Asimina triloba]